MLVMCKQVFKNHTAHSIYIFLFKYKENIKLLNITNFCTVFNVLFFILFTKVLYYILETLKNVVIYLAKPTLIWLQRFTCRMFNFPNKVDPNLSYCDSYVHFSSSVLAKKN